MCQWPARRSKGPSASSRWIHSGGSLRLRVATWLRIPWKSMSMRAWVSVGVRPKTSTPLHQGRNCGIRLDPVHEGEHRLGGVVDDDLAGDGGHGERHFTARPR